MSLKKILICTVSAAVIASGSTAAFAYAEVDGGKWDFGHGPFDTYSNYWHPTKNHGSSVTRNGQKFDSGCASPNEWSRASVNAKWTDSVAQYYRFC
ncbi:lactococcin 972 family bacteriocin [Austwickia chelonae]|uniref:lactococcin 972 family bacteriocin n=1 Tax=Austwickia chelonae TaxID=100225 RepID=UPI0013C2E883